LQKYLATDVPGLWRDRMNPDGSFVEEPAPASSFYHIVGAILDLDAGLNTSSRTAPQLGSRLSASLRPG